MHLSYNQNMQRIISGKIIVKILMNLKWFGEESMMIKNKFKIKFKVSLKKLKRLLKLKEK